MLSVTSFFRKQLLVTALIFASFVSMIPNAVLAIDTQNNPQAPAAQTATVTEVKAKTTETKATKPAISNFAQVSPILFRGGQPSAKAMQQLKDSGVKTIINLRAEGGSTKKEEALAKKLGLNYVHIPLLFGAPPIPTVVKFLQVVNNPENQPCFVHCRQGADRTGMMVGVYNILVRKMAYDKVYTDMRSHHFKPFLVSMKNLVKEIADLSQQSQELLLSAATQTSAN
jgi:protein tyrosine phosphatase (PTP) superfamily phosphohydrolase (DUF442 family)